MSSYDEERVAYKDKVGKTLVAIENLIKISNEHDGLFEYDVNLKLGQYQKKCERLYNKLDKNEFEIAIVGLEKAGKSTFGNALMGNNVLPNADERCTYTTTCIRYGNDRAVVKFFNTQEINRVLRDNLTTLGIENVESYTLDSLQIGTYSNLFERLPDSTKKLYSETVNRDIINLLENKRQILSLVGQPERIFEKEELNSQEFRDHIISPKVAVAVKDVSIESSKIAGISNAVIYDVPGFDSPTMMHEEQTKRRMKECDAIMLIASAASPSFTGPALKVFNDVTDEDNTQLSEKLFIFGNKADNATTLKKNIDTLKSEAKKWKMLDPNQLDNRIAVGSARAHLQKLAIINGNDSAIKVENDEDYISAWSHGDGIEYIYDKLVEYNQTERFQVIKKKVKSTIEGVKELFSGIKENNKLDLELPGVSDLVRATTELTLKAKTKLDTGLKELRQEIRERYNNANELSQRLQSAVINLFGEKNKISFLINDDDINKAKLNIAGVSGSTHVEKVEEEIRKVKFTTIYTEISKTLFSIAQNDHKEYYERIVNIFIDALDVNGKAKDSELIIERIKEYIKECRKQTEDDSIYQSLIERFVRDLAEVLIQLPYALEGRLNKFLAESEVFAGLILFYNDGNAEDGYRKTFLSIPPNNQPLPLALVIHEFKDVSDKCKSFMDSLSNFASTLEFSDLLSLGYMVIKRDPIGGYEALKHILNKRNDGRTTAGEFRSLLKSYDNKSEPAYKKVPNLSLNNMSVNEGEKPVNSKAPIQKFDFDFSDRNKFSRQYKEFFGSFEVRNYDNVKADFEIDLLVLENFLVHAAIPAIRIEKPFVSREVMSIEDLMNKVDNDLHKFVEKNYALLLPSAVEKFRISSENSMANKAAMAEVEKVLETLK